jgi:hypothetical protein
MKRFLLAAGLILAASAPASAQQLIGANQNTACPPTGVSFVTGLNPLYMVNGALCVTGLGGGGFTGSTFGGAMPLTGLAIGMWDGTNLVRFKGDETNGVNVKVTNTNSNVANNADSIAPSTGVASPVASYGYVFDGTNWNRMRGSTSGLYAVPVLPTPSSGGFTKKQLVAITNTAQSVVSGAHQLIRVQCDDTSASWVYLQIYDATSVTMGTTAAVDMRPLAPGAGGGNNQTTIGDQYSTGIMVAATGSAVATSNAAPAGTVNCSFSYN